MPAIVPSFDTVPRDSLRDLLAAAIVIAALYVGADIFVPAALAILLSFVLAPGVRLLRHWHLGRVLPVLAMTALAFLLILAFGALLATQLRDLADAMPRYQSTVVDKVESLRGMMSGDGMARFSGFASNLADHMKASGSPLASGGPAPGGASTVQPMPVLVEQRAETPLETLVRYVAPALHPLTVAGIVGIYAIFILLEREDLRNRAIRLFGAGDLHRSTAAIDDAARRLSRYLLSQLAVNTGAGLVVGIGLSVIGVPSPVLWGVVFGCLRFVPYLGPPLAALAPMALAAAVAPGWSIVLWTAALFLVVESLVGQAIEPMVYGHNTGLSPLAVVIAATFWTVLWGPVGLVLSTPVTVCLVVLGRHVEPLAFLDVMLGDRPALLPREVFYQRMLAGDPAEASDQAERELKSVSLAGYYDDVLLPGLLLAQDDVAGGRLDLVRQQKIAACAGEVVENLSDTEGAAPAAEARSAPGDATPPADTSALTDRSPDSARDPGWAQPGAVLCIGARGPLDDAAAGALKQLLVRRGFGAEAVPHDALTKARIDNLGLEGARLVVLSCLGGGPASTLRFISRRLHRRNATVPILVGAWWQGGDGTTPDSPGADPEQDRDVVSTMAEAVAFAVRTAAARPETGPHGGASS